MNNMYHLIETISHKKILVIGETMLDSYLHGTSSRISREAPVPIVSLQQSEHEPGGAANTALNVASIGADCTFLSVTGTDSEADLVTTKLSQFGVNTEYIVKDPCRKTIAKKRISADDQIIVRFDYGSEDDMHTATEQRFLKRLRYLYKYFDAVILSNYGYGIFTKGVIAELEKLQQKHHKVVIADAKDLTVFSRIQPTAVKPNYSETTALLNLRALRGQSRLAQIQKHGKKLHQITGAQIVSVSLDTEGCMVFDRANNSPYRTFTKPMKNAKAAGAGDTYVSALTVALAAGAETIEAAEFAAAAARIVVQKDGTSHCSPDELYQVFSPAHKIHTDWDSIGSQCEFYREQGKRIVFTNGCFDILHRGHISYLKQAKEHGDILIVGVNSDDSITRLKGPERPINSLADRMEVLAALDAVDHVVAFSDNTPVTLIQKIKPDVFVKGGDYTKASLPETEIVESLGGTVELLPYIAEKSTTNIIRKIKSTELHSTASI